MPDWLDYYDNATGHGSGQGGGKPARVRLQLSTAVLDVYGQEFHDPWLARFDEITALRVLSSIGRALGP